MVWVNVNYTIFQIFLQTIQTITTTSVKVYNNQGFTFSLTGWVSWIIGAVLILVFMGLGWKFMLSIPLRINLTTVHNISGQSWGTFQFH